MAKLLDIFKCEDCGLILEVVHAGDCVPQCNGNPMKHYAANTVDAAKEKHVPVIEKTAGCVTVKVGSVLHPMQDDHYIEWIELLADDKVYRQHLKPGDEPVATFKVDASQVSAREYCNKHGLWRA
ncbi:MAG: desulfoferrodoxin [Candidatus Auribacterota bacterium]|jgi:superoxide reductase|nr:desulfoferrodoxin [Candidatus Auribacterota bacterium]